MAGGAAKILRFNLPWYAAAGGLLGLGCILLLSPVPAWIRLPIAAAMAAAAYWSLASLAVSWYVYDRSPLAAAVWLDGVPARGSVAVFHAGQDEASAAISARFPDFPFRVFDFHLPGGDGTASLLRARAAKAASGSIESIAAGSIPLESGTLAYGLLIFSAHEVRSAPRREAFFRELARVAGPSGRIRLVEHLRDLPNALAYGPGAAHFLSRETWMRTFAAGGLKVAWEKPCTPFVRIFELEEAP